MPREKKLPKGLWKRGGVYYARLKNSGQTIRRRLSTDLDVARTMLNDLRARLDKADFGMIDNNYPWETAKAEFLRWVRQTKRNPEQYEQDLRSFERYCRVPSVQQITHDYVLGYREWRLAQTTGKKEGDQAERKRKRPITPRTVNREVATFRNLLNRAVEWRRIAYNPVAGLKELPHDTPAKNRRALSWDEMERVIEASPSHLKPVWLTFALTGIRHEELVELQFSDIDFEARIIIVRAAWAKNHKAREIPLDDRLYRMIVERKDQTAHRQPMQGWTAKMTEQQARSFTRSHVFVTKANTPWRNNLLAKFYSVCRKAGIEGAEPGGSVDIHSLRVTFCTLALDNGANLKAVQELLGHSTPQLTQRVYNKVSDRSKREAIAALPGASVSSPDHVIPVQKRTERRTLSQSEPYAAAQTA